MSFQRIIIQGNLGGEPEIVETKSGKQVVKFRLAQSDPFTKKTNWFSCEYWRGGPVVGYMTKGGQILVEGTVRQEEWEKDGVRKTAWVVNVDNIHLVGGRPGGKPKDDEFDDGFNF